MSADYAEKDTGTEAEEMPPTQETGLSDTGRRAMQGPAAVTASEADWPSDRTFTDRQGRDVTLRTYEYGDQHDIRAYDRTVMDPLERNNPGQAGYANLRLEGEGERARARLQDIPVPDDYRQSGIGGELLGQAESNARQNNAHEIYGLAPDDDTTREWYTRRGYQFRTRDQSEELFKKL